MLFLSIFVANHMLWLSFIDRFTALAEMMYGRGVYLSHSWSILISLATISPLHVLLNRMLGTRR